MLLSPVLAWHAVSKELLRSAWLLGAGYLAISLTTPIPNSSPPTTSAGRWFEVSAVRFVDDHGTRAGFAAEVVATQECAPARFAPLLLHADARAEKRDGVGRFVADVVGDDAALKLRLCGEVDAAGVRPFQFGPCGAVRHAGQAIAGCD